MASRCAQIFTVVIALLLSPKPFLQSANNANLASLRSGPSSGGRTILGIRICGDFGTGHALDELTNARSQNESVALLSCLASK